MVLCTSAGGASAALAAAGVKRLIWAEREFTNFPHQGVQSSGFSDAIGATPCGGRVTDRRITGAGSCMSHHPMITNGLNGRMGRHAIVHTPAACGTFSRRDRCRSACNGGGEGRWSTRVTTQALADAHPAVLSLAEAAKELGRHPNTLRRWIRAGYLRAWRQGRRGWQFVPRAEIERLQKSES